VGRAPTRIGAPEASRAVIIGVDDYTESPDLDSLPAVVDNVDRLAELLTAPHLWGLAPEHCTVLHNPIDPLAALDAIHDAAAGATDTFLLYFAGHGLLSPMTAELHLALPGTATARLYRALRYDDLRSLLDTSCVAAKKIAILDCCYSGRALKGSMTGTVELADQSMTEGMYVLTAAAESVVAWAPPGERHTAFTGELIRALEHGLPGGDETIEMEPLYQWLRQELAAKGRPVPQQRARTGGRPIALTNNLYGRQTEEAARAYDPPTLILRPLERPIEDQDPVARARQELGIRPGELNEQSTLALAEYLDEAGHSAPAFDLYPLAAQMIGNQWAPDQTANLLRRMLEAGAEAQAQQLFQGATAAVQSFPSASAYLLSALAVAGLTEQAHAFLDVVAGNYPEQDLLTFANYLNAGRQKGLAERAYLTAAMHMGPKEALSLADQLRRHSRGPQADALLGALIANRPSMASGLLDQLRAEGRTADQSELLRVITHTPPDICGQVIEALWRGGQDGAIKQVLGAAADWPLSSLVRLRLSPADPHHSGALADLLANALAKRPLGEFVEAFRLFDQQGQVEYGEVLVDLLLVERDELVAGLAHELGKRSLVKALGLVLFHYAARADPDQLAQLVAGLWQNGNDGSSAALHGALTVRADSGAVLAAFQRAGIGDLATRYLEYLAGTLSPSDLVRLTVILSEQDRTEELNLMLGRSAARPDYTEVAAALHRLGQHSQAYRLAERREELFAG
jgi:Caspase domain